MKIALTGGNGAVGTAIAEQSLARGDELVIIDRMAGPERERVRQIVADVTDYDAVAASIAGCDAVIHMAAIPWPFKHPDHVVHNTNVVGSYNVMRAAIDAGITRICQASSVNALGLSYSEAVRFDYFPLDEAHPTYADEPYGLSKWICEQQADNLVRRHNDVQIASIRMHWVVAERDVAAQSYNKGGADVAKHLWAYTLRDAAARACLAAIDVHFGGHEVFYIVAPETANDTPSLELAATYYPDVPVRGDLSGHRALFSSAKAERLLGWRHDA